VKLPQPMGKPQDPLDETVRLNLKKFREEAGYSQTSAAEMSGVNLDNLRRYENGDTATVPGTVLQRLSPVYGHSVSDFFMDDPPPARLEEAPAIFLRTRPGVDIDTNAMRKLQKIVDDVNREVRGKRRK
jgi:transcriptional regulator with XRE-family HTH domain